jgi:hypothetical protein
VAAISAGAKINIRCEVRPGPFSGEKLVSFSSLEGPISGFVKERELTLVGEKWLLNGIVQEVFRDSILVKVRGSFFTTNGIASISRDLAIAA